MGRAAGKAGLLLACFITEWRGREREINTSLVFAGCWSIFPAKSTSLKGNCLTLRQGSMWKEKDKIELQVTT